MNSNCCYFSKCKGCCYTNGVATVSTLDLPSRRGHRFDSISGCGSGAGLWKPLSTQQNEWVTTRLVACRGVTLPRCLASLDEKGNILLRGCLELLIAEVLVPAGAKNCRAAPLPYELDLPPEVTGSVGSPGAAVETVVQVSEILSASFYPAVRMGNAAVSRVCSAGRSKQLQGRTFTLRKCKRSLTCPSFKVAARCGRDL